jgi:hypothetical protein
LQLLQIDPSFTLAYSASDSDVHLHGLARLFRQAIVGTGANHRFSGRDRRQIRWLSADIPFIGMMPEPILPVGSIAGNDAWAMPAVQRTSADLSWEANMIPQRLIPESLPRLGSGSVNRASAAQPEFVVVTEHSLRATAAEGSWL